MQRVQAGRELGLQSVIDCPVPRQPGESAEGGRTYPHCIMGLAARRCASMTVVQMRLVHYIQLARGKSSSQSGSNALCAGCQFLRH